MRVAVIGCGSIGLRHVKNIVALGHDVIAADMDEAKVSAAREVMGSVVEVAAAGAEGAEEEEVEVRERR